MTDRAHSIAAALRKAISDNRIDQVEAIYDDMITVRYNTEGEAMDKKTAISRLGGLRGAFPGVRYDDVRVHPTEQGFVQESTMKVTMPDGAQHAVELCLVARVGDAGTIVEINEYMDSAALAKMFGSS